MSFGLSGVLEGDIAADHIDALGGWPTVGEVEQMEALQASKDALKLVLSRAFKTGAVSVYVSGHVNPDGTGSLSISLNASLPKSTSTEAATSPAEDVPEAGPEPVEPGPSAPSAEFEAAA